MQSKKTDWNSTTWGELATIEYGKGLRGYSDAVGPYPVFGTNGQIGWHTDYLVKGPGVIIGRKGAYRGVHYASKPFFVIDTAFFLKPKKCGLFDMKWAYYQLLNFDINNIDSGTAIPSTSRDAFYAIPVFLPPIRTQRKIAAVLSAYDDLIENNKRRSQVLEEIAQIIYRQWFVEFKFSGHEDVALIDSGTELGEIPQGWVVRSLDAIYPKDRDIVKTGPFGSKLHAHDYRNRGVPLILVKHVKNGRIIEDDLPLVGDHKLPELSVYRLAEGDIVVTRVGYVGESAYIFKKYEDWLFSGQMLRVRLPNRDILHPRFLAAYYQTPRFKKLIENFAVGATRLSLNTKILANMPVLLPPTRIQKDFVRLLAIFDSLILYLRQKNANLRATRDLLLPRLVSGEVEV